MSRSRESSDASERVATLRSAALGFVEFINAGDPEALKAHQTEDFAFTDMSGKVTRGLQGWEDYHTSFPDYRIHVECVLIGGDGQTPCYLARMHGCRVVGVDILEAMIKRSRERAEIEGVADKVEFRVADAQDLPFEDGTFDAVITESVTVFPEDKERAINEYARVTKPGGYVGLNEATLLKTPPPPEVVARARRHRGLPSGPHRGLQPAERGLPGTRLQMMGSP